MKLIERENIELLVKNLPDKPGVYQYFDANGKIIYIGKAKSLKKRVLTYFTKTNDSAKTQVLVSKIADIRHIVVNTESDALLLENNLIKEYQPKYNVLLKDDKTFPWICITNEPFPRIFYTRNVVRDGAAFYGPYTSLRTVKTLLDLINEIFLLRTCSLKLTDDNIKANKFKICLEYHMKKCKGPCEGLQAETEYLSDIDIIRKIIKGDLQQVIQYISSMMLEKSAAYEFEAAEILRQKIDILKKFQSRSTVVTPEIRNTDVFTFFDDSSSAYVNYLKIMNGAIVQVHSVELKKRIEEAKEDLLAYAVIELRERLQSTSTEIILPFEIGTDIPGAKTLVPQRGDKKKLLELSERNLSYFRLERKRLAEKADTGRKANSVIEKMKYDLRLNVAPMHIECFDNSNIQGEFPVAACVVFRKGKPAKSEYRHFNVKTVVGADDFATMEEILYRRYSRMLEEDVPLPDLIVIDGGKGQLSAALASLEKLELTNKIAIISIAKRLEEIYFPGDPVPLYLDRNSITLKVIQNLRNEAHRFGISFHRLKRSADFIKSELDAIKGVGEKLKEKLLTHFGSVDGIRNASIEDVEKLCGKAKAGLVIAGLNEK